MNWRGLIGKWRAEWHTNVERCRLKSVCIFRLIPCETTLTQTHTCESRKYRMAFLMIHDFSVDNKIARISDSFRLENVKNMALASWHSEANSSKHRRVHKNVPSVAILVRLFVFLRFVPSLPFPTQKFPHATPSCCSTVWNISVHYRMRSHPNNDNSGIRQKQNERYDTRQQKLWTPPMMRTIPCEWSGTMCVQLFIWKKHNVLIHNRQT